jgi:hypothetical protein
MTGRGLAALIPAVFGGLAALISFRYAYSVPLASAAAAGIGWAAVVLCFDLSLMRAAPDRDRLSRLVTLGSRALVSLLAAFTFASSIVMFMFAGDIAVQVASDQQAGLARYNSSVIVPAYAGRITAAGGTISLDQSAISQASQNEASWRQRVAAATVQATCEAQGVSQLAGCGPGTGLLGQGRVYSVRVAELQGDQAALAAAQGQAAAVRSRLSPQIAAAQAALSRAARQEQADYAKARDRYGHDGGLIARWLALNELEAASPVVRIQVLLLECLIIVIDLAAVIAKVTSKTPSYDRVLQARRHQAALRAAMDEEDAAAAAGLRRAERDAIARVHQAGLEAWIQAAQRQAGAQAERLAGGRAGAAATAHDPGHRAAGPGPPSPVRRRPDGGASRRAPRPPERTSPATARRDPRIQLMRVSMLPALVRQATPLTASLRA